MRGAVKKARGGGDTIPFTLLYASLASHLFFFRGRRGKNTSGDYSHTKNFDTEEAIILAVPSLYHVCCLTSHDDDDLRVIVLHLMMIFFVQTAFKFLCTGTYWRAKQAHSFFVSMSCERSEPTVRSCHLRLVGMYRQKF